eukprot:1488005-Pleurochrysis_carterae.AAC.1
MCHVQPLSTTKLIQRCPLCRCSLLRSGIRRALLAIMTRAFVAIGADMRPRVGIADGIETGEGSPPVAA